MNVQVRDGLARCRAIIDANVVTGGFEFLFHLILGSVQQGHQIDLFFCAQVEEGVQVALGNEQRAQYCVESLTDYLCNCMGMIP